jgi:nitroreductase
MKSINTEMAILKEGSGEINFWRYRKPEQRAFNKILSNRSSQRVFNNEKIREEEIKELLDAVLLAPSSCNRQAISISIIEGEDLKTLSTLLVGGIGWANKADKIILLFANMLAYKSPAEVEFMPYLDAGFIGGGLYLKAESMNLGICFVNPNIRPENKETFNNLFNKLNYRFCGAMVLGKYDKKTAPNIKRNFEDIFIK